MSRNDDNEALASAMLAERLRVLPRSATDEDVVAAAQAGELWAFETLYRRHAASTFGFTRRLLGSDADVDDIVQETFARAFARIENLREASAFRSWLFRIVVGRVSRTIRRRKVLRALGLRSRENGALETVLARTAPAEIVLELRQAYARIDELPIDERIAIILRRIEGASLEEIAELTGCSLATVKRRLSRAETALAEDDS